MENKVMKFYSKAGNNIILRAIPGHFAPAIPTSTTMWI